MLFDWNFVQYIDYHAIKNYDHPSINSMRSQGQFRDCCVESGSFGATTMRKQAFRKRGRKRVAKGGAITVAGHRTLAMQADCVTVID